MGARYIFAILNLVGLLSQTSDDVSSEKTKKILREEKDGVCKEYAKGKTYSNNYRNNFKSILT
jgi:hypothetical protein